MLQNACNFLLSYEQQEIAFRHEKAVKELRRPILTDYLLIDKYQVDCNFLSTSSDLAVLLGFDTNPKKRQK